MGSVQGWIPTVLPEGPGSGSPRGGPPDRQGGLGTAPPLRSAETPRKDPGSTWPPLGQPQCPPPIPAHASRTRISHTHLYTYLTHPCTLPCTPLHTLGPPCPRSTRRNVEMAHRRLQRAAAAGCGRRTRMRRKDAVPDASQPGRGGGGTEPRPRLLLPGRRGRREGSTCVCCQGCTPTVPPPHRSCAGEGGHRLTRTPHTLTPPHCRGADALDS